MIGKHFCLATLLLACLLSSVTGNNRRLQAYNGKITKFQLFRADEDTKIADLTNGAAVNFKDIPDLTKPSFNIKAVTTGTVRSVRFWHNGTNYRVEESAPFFFCGNIGSDYSTCAALSCGSHTVSAVPYSRSGAQGSAGSLATVSFAIVCPPPVPVAPPVKPPTPAPLKVTGMGLINADTDSKVLDLAIGTVVNVKEIPGMVTPSFNINASFTGAVLSVVFLYNNEEYSLENGSPFAFCGNSGSNFFKCNKLECGVHTVTAIPYALRSGEGSAGKPFTTSFTIVCPPKPPTSMPSSRPSSAPSKSPTPRLVGAITGLQLFNADSDTKVADLANGTAISIKNIPGMVTPSFNINAAFSGIVRSVRFFYNSAPFRVEEVTPFAFCGNNRTDFFKCRELGCGDHTVSAVPYSLGFAQGTVGSPFTVSFSILC